MMKHKKMHPMRVQRFFKGLSLDELQFRTAINQGRLSRIERGFAVAKDHEKELIARALGVQVKEIFHAETLRIDEIETEN